MSLIDDMHSALAETWAMYFQAHSSHWNVRGSQFTQLHDLFGDLYEDLHSAVDDLAEKIRILDADAPTSLAAIKGGENGDAAASDAEAMLSNLNAANDKVLTALRSANESAEEEDEDGIANFLQERLDKHGKWGWKLRASMENPPARSKAEPDDAIMAGLVDRFEGKRNGRRASNG